MVKEIFEDGYRTTVRTTYDSHLQRSSVESESSDGESRFETFTYPYDYPNELAWMASAHFLSPIVSHSVTSHGMSRTVLNQYSNAVDDGIVPYVSRVQSGTSPDGVSSCYGYDSLDRLNEEFYVRRVGDDFAKYMVKGYEYHYYNEE